MRAIVLEKFGGLDSLVYKDIPDAVIHFFDTGHFALETHATEIAAAIREFLSS